MDVKVISPKVSNYLQVILDKNIIDYLWKIVAIARNQNKSFKDHLAGNISQSLLLEDIDSFFYKSVCVPLVKHYRENNPLIKGADPVPLNTITKSKIKLLLNQF